MSLNFRTVAGVVVAAGVVALINVLGSMAPFTLEGNAQLAYWIASLLAGVVVSTAIVD